MLTMVTEAEIQAAMDNVIQGRTSLSLPSFEDDSKCRQNRSCCWTAGFIEEGNLEQLLGRKWFYAELHHNQMVLNSTFKTPELFWSLLLLFVYKRLQWLEAAHENEGSPFPR